MANPFKKALKGVDKAVKQATSRALNRAVDATSTMVAKDLASKTGLSSRIIKKRLFKRQSRYDRLKASLFIGIKTGLALSLFSPRTKKVKTTQKGNARTSGHATTRTGVTVKIGNQPRQLVPGGFLVTNKAKPLVLARKDQSNTKSKPTKTLRTRIFTEAAESIKVAAKEFLEKKFKDNIPKEIAFYLSKAFKSNT